MKGTFGEKLLARIITSLSSDKDEEAGDTNQIIMLSSCPRQKIFHRINRKNVLSSSIYFISARTLTCFSQPEGDETKDCDQTRGFKTCFTRYNTGTIKMNLIFFIGLLNVFFIKDFGNISPQAIVISTLHKICI